MSKQNGVTKGSSFHLILRDIREDMPEYEIKGHIVKVAMPGFDIFTSAQRKAERQAIRNLKDERKELEKEPFDKEKWEKAKEKLLEENPEAKVPDPPKNLYEQSLSEETQNLLILELGVYLLRDQDGAPLPTEYFPAWRKIIASEIGLIKLIGEQIRAFSSDNLEEQAKKNE